MKLICVGGLSSGCGKTSVACLLLKALPGWAAMKVTPSRPQEVCARGKDCGACSPPDGEYEVALDEEIPARPRKATTRFAEVGASHVAFVRALPEHLPAALEAALARLSGAPGVIVESTTIMPLVDGLRILVAREGMSEVKDSARAAVEFVDLFVVNRERDAEGSVGDAWPALGDPGDRRITACAALPPEHPRNRELVERCVRYGAT